MWRPNTLPAEVLRCLTGAFARMARKEKLDRNLGNLMDEVEQKMFLVKMEYEKYFSGIERIEPLRERDAIKRMLR